MKSLSQTRQYFPDECPFTVRVRATAHDPYAGLKGHDYINARKLNPPVVRVQTSAQAAEIQIDTVAR